MALKVLILGDSHTRAISKASEINGPCINGVDFEIIWVNFRNTPDARGDMPFDQALDRVSGLNQPDLVVISILGTFHNRFSLVQHELPFDFIMPGEDYMPVEGTVLVPYNTVYDEMKSFLQRNRSIVKIRDRAPCRVSHISTPPPKQDNEFIRERVKKYRDKIVDETGISAPGLRLKAWKLEARALGEFCSERGVIFVPAPGTCCDTEGFLKEEYYAQDATHANELYGRLVMQQLSELARNRDP